MVIQTTEDEDTEIDDDAADGPGQFQYSIGRELPITEASRLSRYGFQARQAQRYRNRRIPVAGDAAHQFPATGTGINTGTRDAVNLAWKLAAEVGYALPNPNSHALTGAVAADLSLRGDRGTSSVAALMQTARPDLPDLPDRANLREATGGIASTSIRPRPASGRPTRC